MTSTPGSDLEKGGTSSPNTHHLPFHHGHQHARRFLEFVHPHSGKTLVVCQTPEHLERRRTELLQEKSQDEFDLLLQGSAAHLEAIRDLHAHHEAQRDQLRDQHGDLYANIEHVKGELDALAAEIHHVTAHAVSLDASFDRYGYSAHLRTTDDDSERSSIHSDHPSAQEKHKDRSVEAIQFMKRPTVRQYFHKGLLWRSSRAGEVGSFELFVDLVYVGVIDIVGEKAAEHPDGLSLLQFSIIFCIAWKIWADLTMWINYFEMDDIFQRSSYCFHGFCYDSDKSDLSTVCVIFYLICLFGFTTNIFYAFESTYTSCIAFYVTQRMFGATWFAAVAIILKQVRGAMLTTAIITVITAAVWIASIHVPWPGQLAPIVIAIVLDLFGNIILIGMMKTAAKNKLPDFISRSFEFFPAINIEHRVERNNAFVSLVFGYSILTILFQSRASFGINAFFGKGVLGLIQAFIFNWIYFEIDAYHVHVHAIRRHWLSASAWVTAHLPFIMGYVLAASTLSRLVLAHDCPDADPHDLGEHYEENSEAELSHGLRWFYCGGLGIALVSMAVISFCHVHKRLEKARFRKRPRLVVRLCVAAIIITLPTATSLNSLHLIAITTALLCFVLCVDLYGMSCEGDRFFSGGWCEESKKNCTYSAKCKLGRRRRQELEDALRKGHKVSLADLLKRHSSMSSLESQDSRDEEWHGGHF